MGMLSNIGDGVNGALDKMTTRLNRMKELDPEKDQKEFNKLQNEIKLIQISLDALKEAQDSAAKAIATVTRAVRNQ